MSIDLRYPVGPFQRPEHVDAVERRGFIADLEAAPSGLRAAVAGLADAQLDTPYRPGGWTVRQLVHHVPDSHLNAYVRFKLALTESEPTIRPYDQDAWSALPDATSAPVELSLALLEAVHRRWLACIRSVPEPDFSRRFLHPESGVASLDQLLALYAWHGRHHTAHVTALRERMGWR